MAKIPAEKLPKIKQLEVSLDQVVVRGSSDDVLRVLTQLQRQFAFDRLHHRLLKSKLKAFEACLNNNDLTYAESGLSGIQQLSRKDTRIYLEATSLLAVCYLRKKQPENAKPLIKIVISKYNNINSPTRRRQFQRRFVERIEEECILSDLIGQKNGRLDVTSVHRQAVKLLREKSEDEILMLVGSHVPGSGVKLLMEVREFSVQQLSAPDRKLLPAPASAEQPINLGKRATAVLKRIGWKSLCDAESPIYKLWSKKAPEVCNEAYFAAAFVAAFTAWKIGIPMVAAGVVAIVMKYSAEHFCEWAKPDGLIIPANSK